MQKKFLEDVYGKTGDSDIASFYDAWSASYDDEVRENAYATPGRIAAALAHTDTSREARILDYGCGTGLSGAALVAEGYTLIEGTDLSAEMLAQAETRQIYGRLWQTDAEAPVPFLPGAYDVIAAVGVVSPGAAPAAMLGTLTDMLEPGGRLAFSFNDHALADAAYLDALRELPARGMAMLLEEYGTHLPGIGLRATVYVFEKE